MDPPLGPAGQGQGQDWRLAGGHGRRWTTTGRTVASTTCSSNMVSERFGTPAILCNRRLMGLQYWLTTALACAQRHPLPPTTTAATSCSSRTMATGTF
jgi:hypothetical protein